jgi:hypothetical protein
MTSVSKFFGGLQQGSAFMPAANGIDLCRELDAVVAPHSREAWAAAAAPSRPSSTAAAGAGSPAAN